MIWYLLYPLRGTTEAPVLSPTHPVRSLIARYGRYAARHVVTTLLISVAVVIILLYPIPFLFTGTGFINGASILPHHVWTSAQPLPWKSQVEPDVLMRSIWVHGSYMQALDREILMDALDIQDELLGSLEDFNPRMSYSRDDEKRDDLGELTAEQRNAFHVANGLTNQSWFFHSPLQYWSSSRERLLTDTDLLATVNEMKNLSTSVGVTLRHSIVFSGKRFEERRLVAADALVITLLYLKDSPVGRQWERKALTLPEKLSDKWDIYPGGADVQSSRLYEFQFLPISLSDSVSLALAYCLTLGYFLIGLSKLRAVKSKTGLIVAVVCQIAFSVMSSFTVCAIFNLDLSRIPRAAYPLTILSMSVENVFRLINAVILTPPEDIISNRIGQALGETAPIAGASIIQNVAILLALSRWVSPGVSAFCIFAAVAIVFDFFYLLTFFLSVLSVDVRRLELSDALDKVARQQTRLSKSGGSQRPSWLERVLQGKMALSTRIAGTIVTLGFVLIAQWHFFDNEPLLKTLSRLWISGTSDSQVNGSLLPLKDLHQARSPTSWLRLQDHETAQEVINVLRPSAHSYVARVYEPLVLVLKDADRNPPGKEPSLLPAAYDFVHHHMSKFVVIVVVVIAAIRLLMSYLLWEDEQEDTTSNHSDGLMESSILGVKSLNGGHALDIAMLCRSSEGHVVTVGLDRLLRVWNVRSGATSYVAADGRGQNRNIFPITALAIDDHSQWLAILSPTHIHYWSLARRDWGESLELDCCERRPETCFIASRVDTITPIAIVVWRDGTMSEVSNTDRGATTTEHIISLHGVTCARVEMDSNSKAKNASCKTRPLVVAATRGGELCLVTFEGDEWHNRALSYNGSVRPEGIAHTIIIEHALGVVIVGYPEGVGLVSLDTGLMLQSFTFQSIQPRSLRCVLNGSKATGGTRANTISSVVLAYTERMTGACAIHTYTPGEGYEAIAFNDHNDGLRDGACTWDMMQKSSKRIEKPGNWDSLCDGTVIGIRRHNPARSNGRSDEKSLRRRFPKGSNGMGSSHRDYWEVWTAAPGNRTDADDARPLLKPDEGTGHLLISEIGPSVSIGLMSVAFGFGNVVKIVTVGGQLVFEGSCAEARQGPWLSASRRRKSGVQGRLARS